MRTEDLVGALGQAVPVTLEDHAVGQNRVGLIIVDEVNGFATVGAGPLAPQAPNPQVDRMVAETDRLARAFTAQSRPVLAFLDTHQPGKPEPPYPPHCERGSGQEELIDDLKWLADEAAVTLVPKDCINGFVGAFRADGSNAVVDWIKRHDLDEVLVVGICTDICVMDLVLTLLSARNHAMLGRVRDIVVYAGACATYDLPRASAESQGYGATAAHPQALTHHMGLYFMASRGARLAGQVSVG